MHRPTQNMRRFIFCMLYFAATSTMNRNVNAINGADAAKRKMADDIFGDLLSSLVSPLHIKLKFFRVLM